MPPIAMLDDVSLASFSVKSDGKNVMKSSDGEFGPVVTKVDFRISDDMIAEFDKVEEEMKHEIWYTVDEYDIIKARNSLIVKMMKTGNFQESDEHSFRGLEHKLREGHKQRRSNKFNGLNSVLEEQDKQLAKGIRDMEAIANIYRRVAHNARETAFFFGIRDSEQSYAYKPPPPGPVSMAGHLFANETNHNIRRDDDAMSEMQYEPSADASITNGSITNPKKSKSKFKKFFGLSSSKSKSGNKDTDDQQQTLHQIPVVKRRVARRASM